MSRGKLRQYDLDKSAMRRSKILPYVYAYRIAFIIAPLCRSCCGSWGIAMWKIVGAWVVDCQRSDQMKYLAYWMHS
jgi:hypothetical protein